MKVHASPLHSPQHDRLIVAIDLDAFYLSVERLLNPALNGVPVGVVQKSILATSSYEARAVGVGKLMSVRRAREICPDLVLVNGEDLTKYRAFSKRVRDLVNGYLGPDNGVEKLGLDEVRYSCPLQLWSWLAADVHLNASGVPGHI
jgi:DNA polymerase iota